MAFDFFFPAGHLGHADHIYRLSDNPRNTVVARKDAAIPSAWMGLRLLCLAICGHLYFGHGFLGLETRGADHFRNTVVGGIFCCAVRIADCRDGSFHSAGKKKKLQFIYQIHIAF